MLVIKILIGLAIIFGLYMGLKNSTNTAPASSDTPFTKNAFYFTLASLVLILIGSMWRRSAVESHGDVLNGFIVIAIGVVIACYMIVLNVRRTNLAYGVGGSVVQLGSFFVLAYIAIPLLFIALICQIIVFMSAKPVYVVNR